MARFAEPMSRLIDELRKLPGIGTKSAQRLAFHVLRSSDADARALAEAILVLREKLRLCSVCNNITDVDPCVYCASAVRDQHIICVVEEPTNIATVEKTRSYNGVYHVLHGTLSPIGGVGPEQLRIAELLARVTRLWLPIRKTGPCLGQTHPRGHPCHFADNRGRGHCCVPRAGDPARRAGAARHADRDRRSGRLGHRVRR